MSLLRGAWFVATKDVAYLMRRRETILWTFLMPIVFFYFIGTVTGGFGPTGDRRTPLAVRGGANGGFLLDEFMRRLDAQQYDVVRPATDEAFAKIARRLTIPDPPAPHATFTAAALAGQQQTLTFEHSSDPLGGDYDQVRIARALYEVVADLAVVRMNGQTADAASFAALAAMPRSLSLSVTSAGKRALPPLGFEQAVPGTMVMFTMLVLLTSGAVTLVVEREQGLLKRLASTPISRASVVLGKWGARMALGLVQIVFAMIAGTVLFKMNWGSALPMVLVVMTGWAAFAAGLAIVVASVTRTTAQTTGLGVLSTQVLAALGGCWWPIEITPPWMQKLSLAIPTGWTMGALHKLVSFGDPARVAVPHVVALAAGALVLGWIGTRVFKYQ
ncbi:MAG TPA: ABC transporter permease [Vicinamibacterales bacterium]|nr:ABC transporter permease [Vicinamibacterales bacterium]